MTTVVKVEGQSMTPLSVGELARRLGVRPVQITQLFYERRLRDDLAPIVAGRRLIPPDYVTVIAMELQRRGIEVRTSGATTAGGTRHE